MSRRQGSKELVLNICSQNATFNQNDDYTFFFQNAINGCKTIQLIDYKFIYSFYNVTSTSNTMNFTELGGVALSFTISTGQYDIDSFTTALQAGFNAIGTQTYTVSFSLITGKITITGNNKNFTINGIGSTMDVLLGMNLNVSISSSSNTLIFPNMVNLLPVSEIQIHLPSLINTSIDSNNQNDLIYTIGMGGDSFGEQLTQIQPSVACSVTQTFFNAITVSITDQNGYSIEFDANSPWYLTFKVELW